jgi:hypothetical protein
MSYKIQWSKTHDSLMPYRRSASLSEFFNGSAPFTLAPASRASVSGISIPARGVCNSRIACVHVGHQRTTRWTLQTSSTQSKVVEHTLNVRAHLEAPIFLYVNLVNLCSCFPEAWYTTGRRPSMCHSPSFKRHAPCQWIMGWHARCLTSGYFYPPKLRSSFQWQPREVSSHDFRGVCCNER